MRNFFQNVRFGLRVFPASPGFACVAVLTLGLGIACTATVFSWIDSVLLHPYPGAGRPDELAVLEMVRPEAPNGGSSISWPDYRDYRDRLKGITGLTVHHQCAFMVGDADPGRLAWGELVSGNYFDVMQARPLTGRFFNSEENADALDAAPVAVISERLWRSTFRADPKIAGKTLRVNRHTLTITGVAPAAFRGSSPVMQYDLWIPVTMGKSLGLLSDAQLNDRGDRGMLTTICRLKAGVSIKQARAEAATLARALTATYPKTNRGIDAKIVTPWEENNGVNDLLRTPLTILLAVSFVVLLIVCANVANLLLARSVGRQREFGIRYALGAGRFRVAAQVLTETMVLVVVGAGVGLLMLLWMQGSLLSLVPSVGLPISASYALNGRILGFTALACIAAALISGASPALFVFHSNLNEVLKEGSRSDAAGAASRRTRSMLVVVEVALATVALIGAGLFMRSFQNLRAVNPGFDASRVLFARFFIETTGYSGPQIERFSERLKERLLASPGMESVTYADFVPLANTAGPWVAVRVDGYTPVQGESMGINRAIVAPDYFETMRIPLVQGRGFSLADNRKAEPAIIVNQAFARRYFAGQSPVGRRVRAFGKWCRVIGMAKDSKYFSPAEPPTPHLYFSFQQFYNGTPELYFLAGTAGPPEKSIATLRRAVNETDPNAGAFHAVTFAEYTEVSTFGQKVVANLMGALGAMCLLLAALGLYSVMAYTVSQRIPEIGIRMAMGAKPADVIAMVVGQGMSLAIAGMVLGIGAAMVVNRVVSNQLFGVNATDPLTFAAAVGFLCTVAFTATFIPAYRAARIDPMPALRR